jgi:hypothetical protein
MGTGAGCCPEIVRDYMAWGAAAKELAANQFMLLNIPSDSNMLITLLKYP